MLKTIQKRTNGNSTEQKSDQQEIADFSEKTTKLLNTVFEHRKLSEN